VHGTDAIVVEEAWAPGQGPKADAVIRPGRGWLLASVRRIADRCSLPTRRHESWRPLTPAGRARSRACWNPRSKAWSGSAPTAAASSPCSGRPFR
jgi:hypothetical protein